MKRGRSANKAVKQLIPGDFYHNAAIVDLKPGVHAGIVHMLKVWELSDKAGKQLMDTDPRFEFNPRWWQVMQDRRAAITCLLVKPMVEAMTKKRNGDWFRQLAAAIDNVFAPPKDNLRSFLLHHFFPFDDHNHVRIVNDMQPEQRVFLRSSEIVALVESETGERHDRRFIELVCYGLGIRRLPAKRGAPRKRIN